MPKTQDKYSDEKLNRSQQDYDETFNDMVNQPENQAIDDQGDATARNLKNAENGPSAPNDFNEGDGKDDARRAEAKEWNDPENNFYEPSEKAKSSIGNWSRKRKGIIFGGGVGATVGIISILFMLLPMKVPGLMQLITSETAQKVEQITEKRAKIILGRAILTKFGSNTGVVITGEGAFKTLIASMRTAGFEKRLAAKGLTITQADKGVKLTYKGKPLGNGTTFKNEKAIMDALDSDRLTNKMVKDIVKEEIPAWRWMKRAKFSSWLRIKYGIPKYGLKNSDEKDTKEKKKAMDLERSKASNERTTANFKELVACIMTGSCDAIDGTAKQDKDGSAQEAMDNVDEVASESDAAVEKDGIKRGDAFKTLAQQFSEKFASKALPIIGWIDLAASLDHLVYKAGSEDYVGKIAAHYKGAAYAFMFATWNGYGSQIQLGDMDPEYVGVLADELNGGETAQFFQAIEGDSSKGVPIQTKVNSDKPSAIKEAFDSYTNSAAGFQYKYVGHPVLNAYYQTLGGGGLLGWLSEGIGQLASILTLPQKYGAKALASLAPDAAKEKLQDILREVLSDFGKLLLDTFGLSIDGLDTGPGLVNGIGGGGVVSTNEFCSEIGCRKLTATQAYEQNRAIAAERADYLKQKGVFYALFSPDEAKSVTNQMAIATPSSADGAMISISSMIASVPSRIASIITPPSLAATNTTYEKLYGVQAYGATSADLNKPLSEAYLSEDDCPEVKEGDYNECSVDNAVTEAMICEFDPKSADCDPESGSTLNSGAGSTLRVATFNMRGASHTGGKFVGRMNLSIAAMKRHKFEVIGTQELQKGQRNYLMQKMASTYDSFPKRSADNDHHSVENSILWSTSRFKSVKSGYIPGGVKYFGGSHLNAPWVLLEDTANGQQIYVLNTHDPAFPENAFHRFNNGRLHAKFMNELSKTGLPVIMTGDFNSAYSAKTGGGNVTYQKKHANTIYCVMIEAGISDVLDLSENRKPKCPGNPKGFGNPIDHIFVSKGLEAENYTKISGGYTNNGSDHPTYFADVIIPGAEGEGTAGGWSFPVVASAWKTDGSRWVSKHFAGSQAWTNGIQAAADVNIGAGNSDCGKRVNAMLGGTIVSNPPASVVMQVKSQVNGKTVIITYAHGNNMKQSGTVKAGDQIMTIGDNGNSTACHLHIEIKYGSEAICPQDIFPLIANRKPIDLSKLPKARPLCG